MGVLRGNAVGRPRESPLLFGVRQDLVVFQGVRGSGAKFAGFNISRLDQPLWSLFGRLFLFRPPLFAALALQARLLAHLLFALPLAKCLWALRQFLSL